MKMQQASNRKKTLRAGTPGAKEEKVTHRVGGVRVRVVILGRIGVRADRGTNGTQKVLSLYIYGLYTGVARANAFTKLEPTDYLM